MNPPSFDNTIGNFFQIATAYLKKDLSGLVTVQFSSVEYIIAKNRVLELEKITKHYFLKFDALISPTTIMQALSINDTQSTEEMHERSLLASANTQPVNIFGACAITYPIQSFCNNYDSEKTLPIGLQIICGRDQDNKAVEIALSFEEKFGEPTLPNIKNFL